MKAISKIISIVAMLAAWQISFALPEFPDENHATDWSYQGKDGPIHWGDNEESKLCSVGTQQSPIDIPKSSPVKGASLIFNYQPQPLEMLRDAHNIYIHFTRGSAKPYIIFSGVRYDLIALHFHTPGEHKVQDKKYPMELHLVHENKNGGLLVVGVMIKEGAANSYLRRWLFSGKLPKLDKESYYSDRKLNPAWLLPKDKSYYSYSGSLTTPPCQEGITWVVMKDPITASKRQIAMFKERVVDFNARPIQSLNDRNIILTQQK